MKNTHPPSRIYHTLFGHLPCAIAILKPIHNGEHFILADVNEALQKFFKICKASQIDRKIQEVFPGIEKTVIFESINKVFHDSVPIKHPATVYLFHNFSFQATISVHKIENNIALIFDDTDQSQKDEQELKQFKILCDTSLFGHAIATFEGELTYVNASFAKGHGYQCGDLIGKNVSILQNRVQSNTMEALLEKIRRQGQFGPQNTYHLHKNGEELTMLMAATLLRDNFSHEPFLSISTIDVTEQERINEEHHRLTTAIEQTADTVVITDRNGRIQYVNPAFEKLTGYSQAEAIGINPRILKSGLHSSEFYKNMWDTISSGKVWKGRICNKRKDGTFFTEDARISPVLSSNSEIQNYVAVKQDITKELELLKQLQHAVKMEAVGTLAGGIAHDFNNILTTINGFTILAMETLSPEQEAYEDLQQVLTAGDRAAELVKQILLYSRKQDTDFVHLQPEITLKETCKMLQASLPPKVKLLVDCDQDCHSILADANQIQQIIVNLASNAFHAMKESGGILSITITNSLPISAFDVPHIVLKISDSGSGIDKKDRERIFDPFFTTKAIGEGTGLGLAVVHGIVENHNGSIEVESKNMNGSTFTIRFPATHEEENMQSPTELLKQANNSEHILIVDDEPAVGELLRRILNKAGYRTTFFDSSKNALHHFNTNPTQYDLLLTDYLMPDIDGSELARLMVQKNKKLQVIICTGDVGSFGEENDTTKNPTKVLYKPIQHQQLLNTVRKVLSN